MSNFTPKIKRVTKPTDKSGLARMALQLVQENRYDEALLAFQEILEQDPNTKQAHLGIGRIYLKQKDYQGALTHFQTARNLDPMMVQASLAIGNAYYELKQLELSMQAFQDAVNIDPSDATGYLGIGRVLIKQKQYPQAKEQLQKALVLNPQLILARLLMAQIYQEQGDIDQAITEIESVLKLNPTLSNAYQGLGNLYLKQEKYALARKNFEQAQQLNPKIPAAAKLPYLEVLVQDNALDEATAILKEMPNQKPLEVRKQKLWGDIYVRQGFLEEALQSYRSAALLAAEEGEIRNELSDLDPLLQKAQTDLKALVEIYKAKAIERISTMKLPENATDRTALDSLF
ncbi:TPR repeat-containing protein [Rippkaea orientalis PCC 8801]|uniref:TPR repeat-containing protein n=1 Tax=Rippkaea orientalis (strain PCC 8801 / RF-1) TaxID=41431 RepID=B7JX31_RIPO1|nr:tetratricopeptide repeat protein [Rippkaea orientalis]ACK65880.1 TPR repeat-containing protein [Rippkaea orientalis PCC 8801]